MEQQTILSLGDATEAFLLPCRVKGCSGLTPGSVQPEDFLFANEDGRALTRFQAGHISKPLPQGRAAAQLHPHACRHYSATAFLRAGGDMETLRRLLGHTAMAMTLRYRHMLQLGVGRNYCRSSPVDHVLQAR